MSGCCITVPAMTAGSVHCKSFKMVNSDNGRNGALLVPIMTPFGSGNPPPNTGVAFGSIRGDYHRAIIYVDESEQSVPDFIVRLRGIYHGEDEQAENEYPGFKDWIRSPHRSESNLSDFALTDHDTYEFGSSNREFGDVTYNNKYMVLLTSDKDDYTSKLMLYKISSKYEFLYIGEIATGETFTESINYDKVAMDKNDNLYLYCRSVNPTTRGYTKKFTVSDSGISYVSQTAWNAAIDDEKFYGLAIDLISDECIGMAYYSDWDGSNTYCQRMDRLTLEPDTSAYHAVRHNGDADFTMEFTRQHCTLMYGVFSYGRDAGGSHTVYHNSVIRFDPGTFGSMYYAGTVSLQGLPDNGLEHIASLRVQWGFVKVCIIAPDKLYSWNADLTEL